MNFHTQTLGELLYQFPFRIKDDMRSLEKLKKKVINEKYAILFNETCINEGILPKYLQARIEPTAQNQNFTHNFRRSLIEFQTKRNRELLATNLRLCQELKSRIDTANVDRELLTTTK